MPTEKQAAILAYIRTYQEKEQVPPSSRQVQRHFGFRTQTSVIRHQRALAAHGLLEQFDDGRWGIREETARHVRLEDIPIYGSIPAGEPAFREQKPEGTLPIGRHFFGTPNPLWAVRVQGNSMTGAGIAEGDIAILERREPRPGEIIAALVDGTETTLKRFIVENGSTVLRAANSRYTDILPRELNSQGVLVGILRTQFD